MNYEKKYNEALKRASNLHKDAVEMENSMVAKTCEIIFPELKESEDERIRKEIIAFIKKRDRSGCDYNYDQWISWLEKQGEQKSLDDIVKEVIKDKDTAISFLKSCGIMNENGELADEYKIEQDEQKPNDKVEQKPAWSQEDEMMLECVLDKIGNLGTGEMCKDWLKSLKDRYTWKPSDEQMKALNAVNVDGCISYAGQGQELINLFNDLKKLREE